MATRQGLSEEHTHDFDHIIVRDATENNLKHVSVSIPKGQITVVTGVSGSGKSSLVLDTIAAKSRRELNDTFPSFTQQYLPKYGRPHVGEIENLPIAIVIEQRKPASNSRSTVGTYTDIYALLRLLFSRIGQPFVGYSDAFSFNHPAGSCPRCGGLGEIRELDIHKLVDFDKSLNDEDTIHYIAFGKGGWRWIRYAHSGLFDLDKKIKDYTPEELDLFLHSPQIKLKNPPANWPKTAKYEGLIPRMYRSIINSEEGLLHAAAINPMLTMGTCPDCGGTRLNEKIRSCKINGINIAEVTAMSISDCRRWIETVDNPLAADIKHAVTERLSALEEIGLGYLTLDRAIGTLSGGEAQRCKIAKYINSPLSDVMYILDEPSVGLHNHDILLMQKSIKMLKNGGYPEGELSTAESNTRTAKNTVILVEHHKEIIKIADHIIDMGPGAGMNGGEVVFEGSYDELLRSHTLTGTMLSASSTIKEQVRTPKEFFTLEHASLHNLKDISVRLPLGVMCGIAGVAGSGKSSLMECFRDAWPHPEEIVYISQKNIGISLRSTPATYLDVADDIRKLFAKTNKTKADLFSFNGKGGCPVCQGKGVIVNDMAFMDAIETTCEACGGLRYSPEVLSYKVKGLNIAEVMDLTANKASELFAGTVIAEKLEPLRKVGLGYLHLNQSLSTLSGGELQRIKLASYLRDAGKIFIMDEPSDGLHAGDIRRITDLFDNMVEAGNSIFLIEHNVDMLKACDYLVELGPGGGAMGGRIIFAGTPKAMSECPDSVTGIYL